MKVNRPEPREFITGLEIGTMGFFASSVPLSQRWVKTGVGQVVRMVTSGFGGRGWSRRTQPPVSVAAAAKSFQSRPTLCDPTDGSPPGSAVPGILQARTTGVGCHFLLQCVKVKSESEVVSDS